MPFTEIFFIASVVKCMARYCSFCGEIAFSIKAVIEEEDSKPYLQFSGCMGQKSMYQEESLITTVSEKTFALLEEGKIKEAAYFLSQFKFIREGLYAFCTECGKIYCGNHWKTETIFESDGWYDCTYGVCPNGHRKLIDD